MFGPLMRRGVVWGRVPLSAECGASGVWSYFITVFQSSFELLRLRRFSLARGQCDATPRCVANKWLTRLKSGLWPGGTVTCDSVVFVACDQWHAVWSVFEPLCGMCDSRYVCVCDV